MEDGLVTGPGHLGDRNSRVDLSVIIPILNERTHLPEVCATILGQSFDGVVEYLFIDGGSDDGTRQFLEDLAADDSRVVILDNPDRRTPQALNVGLRHARGECVARMDAHAHYPRDYLRTGVARLNRGDVVNVGGPAVAKGSGRWSRRVALALGTRLGVGGAQFRRATDQEVEVDSGFAGVWRRDTLLEHRGWDEGWPLNQDAELAARLRAAGGRIVCLPAMTAFYIPRDKLAALARQYARYGFYRLKTSRRHPQSMRRSHILPPALVLTALMSAAAPKPVKRAARAGMTAWCTAVAATCLHVLWRGADARDAALLPPVFAAMHFSHGVGFLVGCLRLGPPIAALRHVADLRRSSNAMDRRVTPGTDDYESAR